MARKKVSEEKNGIELINYIAGIDELTSWAEQITNGINVNIQHHQLILYSYNFSAIME